MNLKRHIYKYASFILLLISVACLIQAMWIPLKAQLSQILIKNAWHQVVDQSKNSIKPWPWADTYPIAKIEFQQQGIEWIVLSGLSGEALSFGPSMLVDRDLNPAPMIAGHRDTHFSFLKDIQMGDTAQLTLSSGQQYRYRMASSEVVDSQHQGFTVPENFSALYLITCYPFDDFVPGGPLRYVVRLEKI